jgi:hypothetical protein
LGSVGYTPSKEFVATSLLVPFFKEILPSDLALSEGFFVSEEFIPTNLVIIKLSDLTEFCHCVECGTQV